MIQLGSMCDGFLWKVAPETTRRDDLWWVPVSALQRVLLRAGPVEV